MKAIHLLQLLLLSALWGGSFMLMRIAAPEFGPVPLVAIRVASSMLVLLPFFMMSKQWPVLVQNALPVFILGLVSTAIPFSLLNYTALYANAGYTALLNTMTPIFSAFFVYVWLREGLSKAGILGIALSFIGVIVLVGDTQSFDEQAGLLPIAAALLATVSYGFTGAYTKARLAHTDPLLIAFGSQLAATPILILPALWLWPEQPPGATAWGIAVLQGVFCTGVPLVMFYALILRIGIEKAFTCTYLVPVFAMAWGGILLGESITLIMLLGGALVLCGVGVTTGLIRWRKV